jgi:hypothetical protein
MECCMRQMVKCPDRKGVIAALAQLLYGLGCNILASDQFTAEVCCTSWPAALLTLTHACMHACYLSSIDTIDLTPHLCTVPACTKEAGHNS